MSGKRLQENIPNVVVATSFSGVGTAEFAAEAAFDSTAFGSDSVFLPYASCDFSRPCRSVLCNQECQHVFQSTCDSFPDAIVNKVRSVIKKAKQEFDELQLDSRASKENSLKELGERVLKECDKILRHEKPLCKCWCDRHASFCDRFPLSVISHCLWIEIAGSPCIPWTPAAYGSGLKWLHEDVTTAFLCWIYSLMNQERTPDAILHENVPGFDVESMSSFHIDDRYHIQTFVMSPDEVGFPAARPRRYTFLLRKDHAPLLDFGVETWKRFFFL